MFKKIAALLLTSSVMLPGCYMEKNISYTRPEEPLVKKRTASQLIHYKSKHRVKLTTKEVLDLKDKVEKAQKIQDIRINIVGPHLKSAGENSLTKARINHLVRILDRLGIPNSSIQILDKINGAISQVKWEPEMVVIEVEWYDRQALKSPGWGQVMDGSVAPEGEENFGYTTNHNLAQMVTDPQDLIAGKDLKSSDGQYNSMSIERYQTDKIKAIKVERFDKAQ
ncbi:MAG: hypothetical protein J0H12_02855 [Candidatus Paracaedimonas acanthamoebae]|uniref:Uncharacterized protein n=1 Tax=Candidatus Paracaedimonas acanthamoebae TaxID=244581 RepID=A0A8J7PLU5_9PROT|nr:hypothetical protein [Candidatus Paracaedimonas acanthamoebae]